ncbi:BTB POZ domain-containing protein [Rutstroemia sp. NJR-2017a WRK4]|nr:BTB POZ domain-containing protein [Rutstroemia sp. NJR-2017a WRK4]
MQLKTFDPEGDLLLVLSRVPDEEITQNHENQDNENTDDDTRKTVKPMQELYSESAEEIRMLVSSKHMKLASPVFKAMLREDYFKEGLELGSTGTAEISLPDDDPDAFAILLNTIHGRTRQVPRDVDLDLLSRISTLVDKYQLHEVVEIMSDRWIALLESDIPEEFTYDLQAWLSISWVFEKPRIFREVTKIAERRGRGRVGEDRDDIPIPGRVLDAIQDRRLTAIADAYSIVASLINTGKHHCTAPRRNPYDCSAMILGTLLQSSVALGIFPVPDLHDTDLTFDSVIGLIRKVHVVSLCDSISPFKGFEYHHWSTHGVKQAIDTQLMDLEKRLCGLELDDFKKGKKIQTASTDSSSDEPQPPSLTMTQLAESI